MILLRIVVGLLFVLEGLLRFLRPAEFGAGRFSAAGLPWAEQLAPLTGGVEIGGGLMVLVNLYAGDAALTLIAVALAWITATKLPILFGHTLGSLAVPPMTQYGWLSFLYAARMELLQIGALTVIAIDSGVQVGHRRRWYQSGL
jgi:uncharacterized membrane protein YphA (DoxX/SURF4 family)